MTSSTQKYIFFPYLSSAHEEATVALLFWTNPHSLRSWPFSKFSGWRMNSSHVNLLLVRSHQAEIIIVKRLIQGRNNVTRVRVEPQSCNRGRGKNDSFNLSATLPTIEIKWKILVNSNLHANLGVPITFGFRVRKGKYFFLLNLACNGCSSKLKKNLVLDEWRYWSTSAKNDIIYLMSYEV